MPPAPAWSRCRKAETWSFLSLRMSKYSTISGAANPTFSRAGRHVSAEDFNLPPGRFNMHKMNKSQLEWYYIAVADHPEIKHLLSAAWFRFGFMRFMGIPETRPQNHQFTIGFNLPISLTQCHPKGGKLNNTESLEKIWRKSSERPMAYFPSDSGSRTYS